MKTKILSILISMIMLLNVTFLVNASSLLPDPTDEFYINDFANVIDGATEQKINHYGSLFNQQTGAQVVLVTVDFIGSSDIEQYAKDLFNKWGIGSAGNDNGVLIVMSVGDDDYWVTPGRGLETTLKSSVISKLLNDYLEPDFAAKDYSAGADKIYGAFIERLGGTFGAYETQEEYRYVLDESQVLDKQTIETIESTNRKLNAELGLGVYVMTVPSSNGQDGEAYAEEAFHQYGLGDKDILLLFLVEDDNYWLYYGDTIKSVISNSTVRNILDNVLEPRFAQQDYSGGAENTVKELAKIINNEKSRLSPSIPPVDNGNTGYSNNNQQNTHYSSRGTSYAPIIIIIVLFMFIYYSRRRSYYRRTYGIPFNPYTRRRRRMYGSGGYWGHYGPPPVGGGYWYGGAWHTQPRRPKHTPPSYHNTNRTSQSNSMGRNTSTKSTSFWNSSSGSGGTTRGSGAGRSSTSSWKGSSSSSSSSKSSSSGFGGLGGFGGGSRGGFGGSGRSSSGGGFGGGRSSGGGGMSRGGGAGRKK